MAHVIPTSENAHVGGRITVQLVSSLTRLELTEKENLLLFVSISLIPDLSNWRNCRFLKMLLELLTFGAKLWNELPFSRMKI